MYGVVQDSGFRIQGVGFMPGPFFRIQGVALFMFFFAVIAVVGEKQTSAYPESVWQGTLQDTIPPSFPPGSPPLQTLWVLHTRFGLGFRV
jgi:hypothetical protein